MSDFIKAHTEPFVDSFIIENIGRAVQVLNNPKKCERVLDFDREYEDLGSLGSTIINHDGKIMMYYRGFPHQDVPTDFDERQTTCLAMSTDVRKFEKSVVNRIEYNGSRENNIVFMGILAHNFAPFYDMNPDCPEDERFKAIGGLQVTGGLHIYHSADGIEWNEYKDDPVISEGEFDSMNTAFFDTHTGIYRCYSRYWDSDKSGQYYNGWRAIQSTTSQDFIHWTPQVHNKYIGQDRLYEHFYTNATRNIPGAEHILVSFPMRFAETRKKVGYFNDTGVSDSIFMTSRDGVNWDRTFKSAWIYPEMGDRNWTERSYITLSGFININDEFNFYASDHYQWDDGGINRYSIPWMRFASLYGDNDGAEIITKPLELTGNDLSINYRTSAFGSVRIAVMDEDAHIIEGMDYNDCPEIYGNELRYTVKWNGRSVCELAGKKVKLGIKLLDAYLYSITF